MSNVKLYKSTKLFAGFPCTHRQWRAESHCRFVHGYSRSFYFEFACNELTQEKWVVDFGGLKEVKKWLEDQFDHTFLASQDDPYLETFKKLDAEGVIQLRILPNAGMEGTAEFVYEQMNPLVKKLTNGRAWITLVEVRENEKNSAMYIP
ncbi:MAG: 6-pyruvoyl trahydropterin synthase family protein [Bacteriovoracaceae bacterium]|jgi:6-pyruvoyltetrahydropterin/6-carboxytetrahydropterin synthase